MDIRIGHGYDVHRLTEGRKLILCGVELPWQLGLMGHSDADVAVHALMDALLGAAGMGDIGKLFPDSDQAYHGISSMLLLGQVIEQIGTAGWRVGNADITIIAQRPKLAPYLPEMREKLSQGMEVAAEQLNIKATTEEGLGFTGAGAGIAAHAVVLLWKKDG